MPRKRTSLKKVEAPKIIEKPKLVFPSFASGKIVDATITNDRIKWKYRKDYTIFLNSGKNITKILKKFNEEGLADKTSRLPKKGFLFAIITLTLNDKKSIGKFDYTLKKGPIQFKCQAVTKDDELFDPAKWEFKAEGAFTKYKLLYEVPKNLLEFDFHMNLDVTVPMNDVKLTFVKKIVTVTAEKTVEKKNANDDASDETNLDDLGL